ncbi:MAG: SurA N-terminal domain-containing protein [Flavobacteriales bacterium]|nr:SurA N-terminal domain-containing protein [Flavobacteriales bacterium]
MAIIGKIRERSTLVLIIIGLAIVAFVLTDLFSASASGQQGPANLAEIDGKIISAQDFDYRVQRAYENYELNSQSNQPLDERTKSSIREQVWNEVVSDELVGKEMKKLGITVSTKELFDMVQGKNPHPQVMQAFSNPETGEFNSGAVVQFIQNLDNDPKAKEQWIAFERALKRNKHMDKYNTLIKEGMYMPTELAKMQAKEVDTKITFDYILKPYNSLADSLVQVTEDDIKSYYKNHLSNFEQKANRKAFYAYFPVRPSQLDIDMTQRWAKETYEKFIKIEKDSVFVNAHSDKPFDPTFYSVANVPMGADTGLWNKEVGYIKEPYMVEKTFFIQKVRAIKMAPDSVKASHILINTQDRTPARAEVIADSLLALLKSGSKMADLAIENSDDVGSGQKGGDLGWFTEGMMVKPFNDAAFSANVGEFKKVKSQFGIHIIEVTERTELKKKIQIATIQRSAEASKDTYEEVFNKANSFSINANDLESFNKLVNELNIQRRVAVLSENDNLIQGEAASRDIVRWIKDAEVGDISEAEDLGNAFIVAIVDEINEDGPAPLEKVKATVEFEAKKEAKAKMFIEELSGTSDLNALASKTNLPIKTASNISFSSSSIPNVGIEPEIVGKAYGLQKGQMSIPIQGNSGVFVIAIKDRIETTNPDFNTIKNNNKRNSQAMVDNGLVFNALKDKADIKDNRSKFY